MTIIEKPSLKTLSIDKIRPYWRNPRQIPQEAIDGVKRSIEEFGYQQPIVVDADGVIIVGHTRYAALRQLGATKVPVHVSDLPPEKAQEYRVIDNRSGEFTSWDEDNLLLELREVGDDLMAVFFPDIDLEAVTTAKAHVVTQNDLDKAQDDLMQLHSPPPRETTEITCPQCYHNFTVELDSLS